MRPPRMRGGGPSVPCSSCHPILAHTSPPYLFSVSVCLPVHRYYLSLSLHPFIHLSICPPIHPSIRPPAHPWRAALSRSFPGEAGKQRPFDQRAWELQSPWAAGPQQTSPSFPAGEHPVRQPDRTPDKDH